MPVAATTFQERIRNSNTQCLEPEPLSRYRPVINCNTATFWHYDVSNMSFSSLGPLTRPPIFGPIAAYISVSMATPCLSTGAWEILSILPIAAIHPANERIRNNRSRKIRIENTFSERISFHTVQTKVQHLVRNV